MRGKLSESKRMTLSKELIYKEKTLKSKPEIDVVLCRTGEENSDASVLLTSG